MKSRTLRPSWTTCIAQYKFQYGTVLFLAFLLLPLSLATVLLVSYAFNQINGGSGSQQNVLVWSEFLGEHAARWMRSVVRHTPYELGIPFEFQQQWFPILLFCSAALLAAAKFGQEYLLENLGEKISLDLRTRVAQSYSHLPFQATQGVEGALLSQMVGDDTKEVRQAFTRLWGSVPTDLLQCLLYASFLILLDTNLFSLLIAIIIPAGIVIRVTGVSLKRLARQGLQSQTELLESLLEKFQGWQSIQVMQGIRREVHAFKQTNDRLLTIWRRSTRAKALGSPLVEWLGLCAAAFVLVLALRRISEGELNSQILTSFVVVIAQLSNAGQSVAQQLNSSRKGTEALRRILRTTALWEEAKIHVPLLSAQTNEPNSLTRVNNIQLVNLALAESHTQQLGKKNSQRHSAIHKQEKKTLAEGLNLYAEKGDLIVIQGPSGSGKSTLLRVLLGLEEPLRGKLLWNDNALTPEVKVAVSHDLAFLPQEPFIVEGTTFDNIAYPLAQHTGQPPTQLLERAEEALRKANLQGKDLFENPQNYSGGEKQRLMFARAFFRQATVWMVDEATSALDSTNEADILKLLKENTKEHIIFMVAHRKSVKNFGTKHISLGQDR